MTVNGVCFYGNLSAETCRDCVSVVTEVGSDLQQTMESSGTLIIEEGDGTTITVTHSNDDDSEVSAVSLFACCSRDTRTGTQTSAHACGHRRSSGSEGHL